MKDEIIIFTDGSSLGNPGPGGWAAILIYKGKRKELSGGFNYTTNNRMELLAVIKALSGLKHNKHKISLYSDSKLIIDAVNKGWLANWKKNGWKKSDKKAVLNKDLWEEIDRLLKIYDVKFNWIEGHAGIEENENCDVLCKYAASSMDKEDDIYYLKSTGNNEA